MLGFPDNATELVYKLHQSYCAMFVKKLARARVSIIYWLDTYDLIVTGVKSLR